MIRVYLLIEESWFRGDTLKENLAVYESLEDVERVKKALEVVKSQKDRYFIEVVEFISENKCEGFV